jgi:hypothetical protein
MGDGALGTHTRFQNLLRHMSATELANLFQAFGFDFVTTQWISRVTKAGKFNLDVDQKLNPLILRVEDLIGRFNPSGSDLVVPISFQNPENIKFLLDVISMGVELTVGTIQRVTNSNDSSTTIPAAQ